MTHTGKLRVSEYKPRVYKESQAFFGEIIQRGVSYIRERGDYIRNHFCVWSFSHLLFVSQEKGMKKEMLFSQNVLSFTACEREPTNRHSQNAIAGKNKGQQMIGHVPEALASKLFTLM